MLAAIFIIVGLILLILVHEIGHFLAAKQAGIRVEEFGIGFPPRITGWQRGETFYSINWLPIGGFVKIYGENKHRSEEEAGETGVAVDTKRAFFLQSFRRRFVVIAAGISINFIVGWLLLASVYMVGAREAVVITDILEDSPAATAHLQRGDELVGFKSADHFIAYTSANQGKAVTIEVLREDMAISVPAQLREAIEGQAPLGAAIGKVGFAGLPFFAALQKGLIDSVTAVADIFRAFGSLIADLFGHAKVPESIVGPVGILGIAGDLGKLGFVYIVQLIAMISLNLAALNAIPFPALDGGRILFMVIEKIKGSPLNPKRELWANLASFGFLIILMLVITSRDIIRLF